MKKEIIKTVCAILFAFICFCFLIFLIIGSMNSSANFQFCKDYKNQLNVIFEKNTFIDKCYIVENGTEYTVHEYYELHKYDGMEVRE